MIAWPSINNTNVYSALNRVNQQQANSKGNLGVRLVLSLAVRSRPGYILWLYTKKKKKKNVVVLNSTTLGKFETQTVEDKGASVDGIVTSH